MRPTPSALQGFQDEKKVPVDVRHWEALRRLVWRMKVCWGFVENEALSLLSSCRHADGCPAVASKDEPCLPECPDRQTRLSALVFYNNAHEFAHADVHRATGSGYVAPSREYFDAVLGELTAAQAELTALRETVTRTDVNPEESHGT